MCGALLSLPAAAQQMGRDGYNFPARSSSLAAQFQFQQRLTNGSQASTAAGLGALNQLNTTYNSTSNAIANMNSVTQVLSDGSTGTVSTNADQDSAGDQGATATTDTAIDNSINDSGNLAEVIAPTVPAPAQ